MGEVIIVCGPPGVGKSKISKYISNEYDIPRYDSDEVRKSIFDDPDYTESETDRTYFEMFHRAFPFLRQSSAVFDATFSKKKHRDYAVSLSDEWTIIRLTAETSTVRERLKNRDGVSDADYRIYLQKKQEFETIKRNHIAIDNSGPFDDTIDSLERAWLSGRKRRS